MYPFNVYHPVLHDIVFCVGGELLLAVLLSHVQHRTLYHVAQGQDPLQIKKKLDVCVQQQNLQHYIQYTEL
jgi:hypothetical protein